MEKKFANGIMFKRPREGAPEFIKGNISIKVDEFIKWLTENKTGDWMNLDLKESKNKTLYLEMNTWKKETSLTPEEISVVQQAREEAQKIEKELNPDIPF